MKSPLRGFDELTHAFTPFVFVFGGEELLVAVEDVVESADLAVEGAGVPVLGGGFVHIPLASGGVIDTQQGAVVGPAQFVTQCVTIRECLIEQPHVAEIGCIEALSKFGGELGGNLSQHRLAIRGAGLAALLEFDDVSAHNPTGAHLHHVHCVERLLASFQNDGTQVGQETEDTLLHHHLRRLSHHW
jgi:hypothetical protein